MSAKFDRNRHSYHQPYNVPYCILTLQPDHASDSINERTRSSGGMATEHESLRLINGFLTEGVDGLSAYSVL